MTNWAMWQSPTSTILAGLKSGVAAANAADDEDAVQAYAANPNDPAAQQKLLARNPTLFTQISDAATSQLKARKALLDTQQAAAADGMRRAVIAAHPEWFGGTASPSASAPQVPAPTAPPPIAASPASAAVVRPGGGNPGPATVALTSLTSGSAPAPTTGATNASRFLAPDSASAVGSSGSSPSGAALLAASAPQPSPPGAATAALQTVGSNGANASPPTAASANASSPNDIVVTGQRQKPVPGIADLAMLSPDDASKLLVMRTHVASLGEADRKALDAKTETWMSLYPQLTAVPYAQRQAIIDASRPILRDHGFSDKEIDSFDPTDTNLTAERNLALGYKGVLSQQNSDRQFGEEVRSHKASEASAAEGHAIAIRGQNMADARARDANTVAQTAQNEQAIDYYADALRTGMPLPSFGNGRQAAAMRMAIATRAAVKDAADGKDGRDLAAARARYAGFTAGERTVGTRTANIDLAGNEAANVIPLARAASNDLSRSGFLPLARVQQMIQNGNNDPRLRTFVTANNAVVNTYARAISPTGVPHVTDQEHARQMLSTAFDQPSYNAVLNQMQREIAVAKSATGQVRTSMDSAITGRPPAAPQTARNPRTGQRVQLAGGRWVPIQ